MSELTNEEKKERFLKKHPALDEINAEEELVKDPKTGEISKRKISFIEKPKKPRTVEDAWKAHDEAKAKYAGNIQKVEENLLDFLKIEDPIVYNEKVLAMMRRPSNLEIRNMVPKELAEYESKPITDIPDEVFIKYDKTIYGMMSELITKPKWTVEQWTTKSNPWFMRLFWEHISNIIRLTQAEISGF